MIDFFLAYLCLNEYTWNFSFSIKQKKKKKRKKDWKAGENKQLNSIQ